MAIKASIALMLLRLSVSMIHKRILWVTIVIVEIYSAFCMYKRQYIRNETKIVVKTRNKV